MSTPTIDDIQLDIWHLYHLLDALNEHMVGMPHVRDGVRDNSMDRASAVAWIARDAAKKLCNNADAVAESLARKTAA